MKIKRELRIAAIAFDALIGVEIKETWYDGSAWWAVAVMDKSRGRAAYSAGLLLS